MARAVREQLHLGLGVQPPRASVWLLGPPPRLGVHGDAWALVCLAAVAAMEHGRAHLWALHHQGGGAGAPLPPARVSAVAASAVASFWRVLHDFAAAGGPELAERWGLQPEHPFLAPAGPARGLGVRWPVAAPPPAG